MLHILMLSVTPICTRKLLHISYLLTAKPLCFCLKEIHIQAYRIIKQTLFIITSKQRTNACPPSHQWRVFKNKHLLSRSLLYSWFIDTLHQLPSGQQIIWNLFDHLDKTPRSLCPLTLNIQVFSDIDYVAVSTHIISLTIFTNPSSEFGQTTR